MNGFILALALLANPSELEVFFEVKLLVRSGPAKVDQWTAGRVRMRAAAEPDGSIVYRLSEIVESPWTFRWYPAKDEVKLGAAVWVEHPTGHPYGSLAPSLEEQARAKFDLWWEADPEVPGPPWSAESGRFWAQRHRKELADKDALPEHPTYPFHVLGPLDDRFGFTIRDGVLEDVVETMSRPWVADGWADAVAGEAVRGYGFWESKRPRWEPRTYETFAAALTLLGSPGGNWESVLTAMQPAANRLRTDVPGEPRTWRNRKDGSDELQILVTADDPDAFKFWVRVVYREVPRRKP